MKKRIIIVALAISMALFGCQKSADKKDKADNKKVAETTTNKEGEKEQKKPVEIDEKTKKDLLEKTEKITTLLSKKNFDEFKKNITEKFKKAAEGQDLDIFKMLSKELGDYKGIKSSNVKNLMGRNITDTRLEFQNGTVDQIVAFDDKNIVDGINFLNLIKNIEPEEGETKIKVDAGTGYPVDGMIKMPKGEVKAGVVLVDGSGPNDMNMRLGKNQMMKHLSDELAKNGIAVLRFNKRTYQYGKEIAEKGLQNKIFVKDEFIDDAATALKLLKNTKGVPKDKLFLLGHSQSGSYLPAINEAAGNIAKGYIITSGTTKNMAEAAKDQYKIILDEMDKEKDKKQIDNIKEQIKKQDELLAKFKNLSDEELKKPENNPFGIPAEYLKDTMKYDVLKLYNDSNLPTLIRIGEFDKQVPTSELKVWKDGLKNKENVDIGEIKGANHLMQPSDGKIKLVNLIKDEYQKDAPIVPQFVNDVVDFINKTIK